MKREKAEILKLKTIRTIAFILFFLPLYSCNYTGEISNETETHNDYQVFSDVITKIELDKCEYNRVETIFQGGSLITLRMESEGRCLKDLPEELTVFKKLRTLELNSVGVKSIDNISQMDNLRKLYIPFNEVDTIVLNNIPPKLEEIVLIGNLNECVLVGDFKGNSLHLIGDFLNAANVNNTNLKISKPTDRE